MGGANLNMRQQTIKKRVWETLLYDLVFKWSGRQDSNLRPSAQKALGVIFKKTLGL